jgi:hypothetical protein
VEVVTVIWELLLLLLLLLLLVLLIFVAVLQYIDQWLKTPDNGVIQFLYIHATINRYLSPRRTATVCNSAAIFLL